MITLSGTKYSTKKISKHPFSSPPPGSHTTQQTGKRETATHKQCYSHIKPFFKLLRRKKSPKDILRFVKKIVDLMQAREYLQANDFYVRMAIGNSPWPIGVTRAGIHVRAADERISTANVAHVLNNELQRKYIQSLKRYAGGSHSADGARVWTLILLLLFT